MSSVQSQNVNLASARVTNGWDKVYKALVAETHDNTTELQKREKLNKKLKNLKLELKHLEEVRLQAEKNKKSEPWYLKEWVKITWISLGILAAFAVCGAEIVDQAWSNTQNFSYPAWLIVISSAAAIVNLVMQSGSGVFEFLEGRQKKKSRAAKKQAIENTHAIAEIRYHLSKLLKTQESDKSKLHMTACIDNLNKLPPEYILEHKEVGFAIGILLQLSPDEEIQAKLRELMAPGLDDSIKGKTPVVGSPAFLRVSGGDKDAEGADTGRSFFSIALSTPNLHDVNKLLMPQEVYVANDKWEALMEKMGTHVDKFRIGGVNYMPESSRPAHVAISMPALSASIPAPSRDEIRHGFDNPPMLDYLGDGELDYAIKTLDPKKPNDRPQ